MGKVTETPMTPMSATQRISIKPALPAELPAPLRPPWPTSSRGKAAELPLPLRPSSETPFPSISTSFMAFRRDSPQACVRDISPANPACAFPSESFAG